MALTDAQKGKIRRCVDDMIAKGGDTPKSKMFAICTSSVVKESLEEAALSDKDFAVPGKRKLPINDEAHVRNALARFNQTEGLNPEEKKMALRKILAAAKKYGVKVTMKESEDLLINPPAEPKEPSRLEDEPEPELEPEDEESEPEESEVLESMEINFTESFNVLEQDEGSKGVPIQFVAVQAGLSNNDRRYKKEELEKQNLKGLKMFTDHNHEADNVVGVIKESYMDGRKLMAKAIIKNSFRHPDIEEMIKDGRIDAVSIGAKGIAKRVKEGDKVISEINNLQVKEVSFVGIGGIENAKIKNVGG